MDVLFKQIGRLKIGEPHWNLVEELPCQHLSACVSQAIQYEFNAHQGLFLKNPETFQAYFRCHNSLYILAMLRYY